MVYFVARTALLFGFSSPCAYFISHRTDKQHLATINFVSANLLADAYIKNHKAELGYLPEWLNTPSEPCLRAEEAEHDYALYHAASIPRNVPWPKQRYFPRGFGRGLVPEGDSSVAAAAHAMQAKRIKAYDECQRRIPSQPARLEALLTTLPLTGAALKNFPEEHYVYAFQELTRSSKRFLESETTSWLPRGRRVVANQHGDGKDDYAAILTNLPVKMCTGLQPKKKPYVLATGRLSGQKTMPVQIGLFCVHGEVFENGLKPGDAAVFVVMGDWNVQWADEQGRSIFEQDLGLEHSVPPAGASSMYAHEYGNARTVIDHIAWKAYGGLEVSKSSTFVEGHRRYTNAPILYGYWGEPTPMEQCLTDHAPVGVQLQLRLPTA